MLPVYSLEPPLAKGQQQGREGDPASLSDVGMEEGTWGKWARKGGLGREGGTVRTGPGLAGTKALR